MRTEERSPYSSLMNLERRVLIIFYMVLPLVAYLSVCFNQLDCRKGGHIFKGNHKMYIARKKMTTLSVFFYVKTQIIDIWTSISIHNFANYMQLGCGWTNRWSNIFNIFHVIKFVMPRFPFFRIYSEYLLNYGLLRY